MHKRLMGNWLIEHKLRYITPRCFDGGDTSSQNNYMKILNSVVE
ncbi:hypothetical protein ACP8HZ_02535 [Francisella noatunensis]